MFRRTARGPLRGRPSGQGSLEALDPEQASKQERCFLCLRLVYDIGDCRTSGRAEVSVYSGHGMGPRVAKSGQSTEPLPLVVDAYNTWLGKGSVCVEYLPSTVVLMK